MHGAPQGRTSLTRRQWLLTLDMLFEQRSKPVSLYIEKAVLMQNIENHIKMILPQGLEESLSNDGIDASMVEAVILNALDTGNMLMDESDSTLIAHLEIGSITLWARFKEIEGKTASEAVPDTVSDTISETAPDTAPETAPMIPTKAPAKTPASIRTFEVIDAYYHRIRIE